MRVIGLDVHRNFAQVAILENGLAKDHGRFAMEREAVLLFAKKVLTKTDDVVLEATGNTAVIVRLLTPFVHRVVIANPLQVRAIAWPRSRPTRSTPQPWLGCMQRSSCWRSGCRQRRSNCSGA
jgi:hypothetical protein